MGNNFKIQWRPKNQSDDYIEQLKQEAEARGFASPNEYARDLFETARGNAAVQFSGAGRKLTLNDDQVAALTAVHKIAQLFTDFDQVLRILRKTKGLSDHNQKCMDAYILQMSKTVSDLAV